MINFDAFFDRYCDICGEEYNQKERPGLFCSDECAEISKLMGCSMWKQEETRKRRDKHLKKLHEVRKNLS